MFAWQMDISFSYDGMGDSQFSSTFVVVFIESPDTFGRAMMAQLGICGAYKPLERETLTVGYILRQQSNDEPFTAVHPIGICRP
jgi:hypothetical protein